MINILLVEDDEIFRIGLTVSLKQSTEVTLIGTCGDGKSAIALTEELNPDVVLMDLGLPILDGIEATRQIKAINPSMKVLALTSHTESKIVNQIMDAGADGFCLKGVSTERLIASIKEVFEGNFWVDASIVEQIKLRLKRKAGLEKPLKAQNMLDPLLESLTDREQEVLALIAEGRKNSEIAAILGISHGTVRVHVHSILHKLDVKDRTQAAILAHKPLSQTD
jgi:two-component system NarL family response regulator